MSPTARSRLALLVVMLIAAGVFVTGINWGLPSRRVDPFLFGDHPVWTGAQIVALAGERPNDRLGADVDVNPILPSLRPVVLNDTDAKRAEIIRRYRLYTYQPDEMITMMSLASMHPGAGDLDPKLYQYGGLWIYPVGALLKIASVLKLIHLDPSQAYYLDHPEEFGRFYIVARAYVVAWALVGVWACWWIARRMSGGNWLIGAAAALCYAVMPVVVNMAHEAKPHLPGAVLILLAIIAATRFIETGRTRWWMIAGALCGAAFGMVLSALLGFVILPAMTILRRTSWNRRIAITLAAVACGLVVYALTNPYVMIHLIGIHREILTSNLRNSTAMYQSATSMVGARNAIYLIATGATPVLAALGVVAVILPVPRRGPTSKLLAVAAVLIAGQFVALATGKPAEYARFALLPDIALAISAVVGVGQLLRGPRSRPIALGLLCVITSVWAASYVWHFVRDSAERSTRIIAAERLAKIQHDLASGGGTTIAIYAEPAPYCLPPVDLFHWRILLAADDESGIDVAVRMIDEAQPRGLDSSIEYWFAPRLLPTPISWAAKPMQVTRRAQGNRLG